MCALPLSGQLPVLSCRGWPRGSLQLSTAVPAVRRTVRTDEFTVKPGVREIHQFESCTDSRGPQQISLVRVLGVLALSVVGATGAGVTGVGAVRSQEPEPALGAPPVDNVFPVPLPYVVSFEDSWHACRDECARRHKGNDLMADEGVPVAAVEAGVIVEVDNVDDGNGGLSVWLRGDSGVAYYYAHNSANLVLEGQRVVRGDTIARVGRTGNARTTPPHIHFQINLCGETSSAEPCTVDPYPYLSEWDQAPIGGGSGDVTSIDGAAALAGDGTTDSVGWFDPETGTFAATEGSGFTPPAAVDAQSPDGTVAVSPVAGDWDGDGRASVGLYDRAQATFVLFDDEGRPLEPAVFGEPGREDVWPVAGDFDGDGRDTVGVYRQADATFVVHIDGFGAGPPVLVGTPGRTDAFPIVGDWDGNGRDGLGVYQRRDGTVLLVDDTGAPSPASNAHVEGGGALPVAGDWDGDGRDTVGVLHVDPATGSPSFDLPMPDGDARWTIPVTSAAGVLPLAGDWDGPDPLVSSPPGAIIGEVSVEAAPPAIAVPAPTDTVPPPAPPAPPADARPAAPQPVPPPPTSPPATTTTTTTTTTVPSTTTTIATPPEDGSTSEDSPPDGEQGAETGSP